jgi:hypothetical protein
MILEAMKWAGLDSREFSAIALVGNSEVDAELARSLRINLCSASEVFSSDRIW